MRIVQQLLQIGWFFVSRLSFESGKSAGSFPSSADVGFPVFDCF